jgi:hypothetical protein
MESASAVNSRKESHSMTEKIVVQCECGKKYRLPAAKAGKKLKCKKCGAYFVAEPRGEEPEESWPVPPSAPPPAPAPTPAETIFDISELEVDEPVKPEKLIAPLHKVNVMPLIGISVLAHVVILAITSIHYFMLVPEYGWMDPEGKQQAAIRKQKEEEKRAQLKAEREARLAEMKEKAEEAKKRDEKQGGSGKGGAAGTGDQKDPFADQISDEVPTVTNPMELED